MPKSKVTTTPPTKKRVLAALRANKGTWYSMSALLFGIGAPQDARAEQRAAGILRRLCAEGHVQRTRSDATGVWIYRATVEPSEDIHTKAARDVLVPSSSMPEIILAKLRANKGTWFSLSAVQCLFQSPPDPEHLANTLLRFVAGDVLEMRPVPGAAGYQEFRYPADPTNPSAREDAALRGYAIDWLNSPNRTPAAWYGAAAILEGLRRPSTLQDRQNLHRVLAEAVAYGRVAESPYTEKFVREYRSALPQRAPVVSDTTPDDDYITRLSDVLVEGAILVMKALYEPGLTVQQLIERLEAVRPQVPAKTQGLLRALRPQPKAPTASTQPKPAPSRASKRAPRTK